MRSVKTLLVAVMVALAAFRGAAAEADWLLDLSKAKAKAKAEQKLVLLNFTGSDWCGWCIKLDKEVFSTPEFAAFAEDNLVLVKLDFPRRIKQPSELKKANARLQDQYRVESYPTIVVLNPAGREVGRLQYMPGGPKPFLRRLTEWNGK